MKRWILMTTVVLAGCGAGLDESPASEVSSRSQALIDPFEPSVVFSISGSRFLALDLVGRGLNGTAFNGKVLADRAVAKVLLSDVSGLGGGRRSLHLKGSRFQGARSVVGAVFTGVLDDGETLPLQVDDAVPGVSPSDLDVVRYAVSYQTAQGWLPLCGLDPAGEPVRAIPLAGTWDLRQGVPGGGEWVDEPGAFTFACEGYVLAKCVDMGYAPWREGRSCPAGTSGASDCTRRISLAPYHQACTRMLRADYCGDGTSNTQDGTAVNAYDRIGVRFDSEDWAAEAEWTGAGAACLARLRDPAAPAPACSGQLPVCGEPSPSALLFSELLP